MEPPSGRRLALHPLCSEQCVSGSFSEADVSLKRMSQQSERKSGTCVTKRKAHGACAAIPQVFVDAGVPETAVLSACHSTAPPIIVATRQFV